MWDILGFLAFMAGVAALAALGPRFQRYWARRATRRFESGQSARFSVRLAGPRPYPRFGAWGSVDSADEPLVFRRWHRMTMPQPLTGLTFLGREIDTNGPGDLPLVVFRLRDAEGRHLTAGVNENYAETFEALLHRAPTGGPVVAPRRYVPRWRLALAGLAVLWLVFWVYVTVFGSIVDATVLTNDGDGYCTVEYGGTRFTDVDCAEDELPGDRVKVIVMAPPFEEDAVDVEWTIGGVSVGFLLGMLPLALTGIGRLRHRNVPMADGTPTLVGEVERAAVEPHEMRWSTISRAVERRAVEEDWRHSSKAPWWARRARGQTMRVAAPMLPRIFWALFAVGIAALAGVTAWSTALRWNPANAVETEAVVTYVDDFFPGIPADVDVEFTVDGRKVTTHVASTDEPHEDERIGIRYDATNPKVARRVEHDGVGRGQLVSSVVGAVAFGFIGWTLFRVARILRTLRRRRRQRAEPMRYAVGRDMLGDLYAMLFETGSDGPPVAAVALYDPLGDLPVTGDAGVHGPVEPGAALVLTIGGRAVYPASFVTELDEYDLDDLVNGEARLLGEEEPGFDD